MWTIITLEYLFSMMQVTLAIIDDSQSYLHH